MAFDQKYVMRCRVDVPGSCSMCRGSGVLTSFDPAGGKPHDEPCPFCTYISDAPTVIKAFAPPCPSTQRAAHRAEMAEWWRSRAVA